MAHGRPRSVFTRQAEDIDHEERHHRAVRHRAAVHTPRGCSEGAGRQGPGAERACCLDAKALCPDAIPDEGKVTVCFEAKRPKLGPACGAIKDQGDLKPRRSYGQRNHAPRRRVRLGRTSFR